MKICGFARPEDVQRARELDIDAIGVVLDEGPTRVTSTRAGELRDAARGARFEVVVVAGPAGAAQICELLDQGYDRVQAVVTAETLAALPPDLPVLPVFFDDDDLVDRVQATVGARPEPGPEPSPLGAVNVDGRGGGGRGRAADWGRAREIARSLPLMLSGGLRDDNVAEAIRAVRPRAVDVSSFTEAEPGRKSWDRVARFVEAVRRAER